MGFEEADFTVWLMMRDGYRLELIHFDRPKSAPLPQRPRTNSLGLSHLTVGIEEPEKTLAELKARGVKVWEHTVGNFVEAGAGVHVPVRGPGWLPDRDLHGPLRR